MDQRLLVINQGENIPSMLLQRFEQEGYQVRLCMEKGLILAYLLKSNPSIIILEGWQPWELEEIIANCILRAPQAPLVVLSKEKSMATKVKVLEQGADDYIEIPFYMEELVARVNAHLRRANDLLRSKTNKKQKEKTFHFNLKKNEVYKNHQPLALSFREYQLLKCLLTKENHVFSRKELLNKVWGYGESEELYCDIRTVDVTVRRVREKIEDNPKNPKHLLTKRGLGYYFQDQEEEEGWQNPSSVEITLKK